MWTVYLMTKEPRTGFIHAGCTPDIKKLFAIYQQPAFQWPVKSKIYHLEQDASEKLVKERFLQFSQANKVQLIELIESVNPEWIEYLIGVNILV